MKSVLILLVLLASQSSFADISSPDCEKSGYEVQFFAKVTEVQRYSIDEMGCNCTYECAYKLKDFRQFGNSHAFCPLTEAKRQNLMLIDTSCKVSEGDEVSGVLVLKNGRFTIE